MANGDFDVKTLSKSRLVGGGIDINGNAKNAKTRVVCSIAGDYITGGIVLDAVDLGLSTLDAVFIGSNVYSNGDTAPSATNPRRGVYLATSSNQGTLMIVTGNNTQAEAAQTNFSVTVVAFGDSAEAPEFT